MSFAEKIKKLSEKSSHASAHALTEEATKTSVIFPFIQSLGFDVFNLGSGPVKPLAFAAPD
jgi:hypothetical protein